MDPITRILCPVDFSDTSRHAIEHALAVARWCKASITALYVSNLTSGLPGLPPPEDGALQAVVARLHSELVSQFEGVRTAGINVDVVVDVGQPAATILERARLGRSDLIVMGTHGASGFEHLLLGSVTEKVLRRAPCPVLTVPPRAQATSQLPFKRLLCAIDFSDSSLRGLELAHALAKECGARLILLHTLEWPWPEPPPPVLEELPPDQAAGLRELRRYLETSATQRLEALIPREGGDRCAVVPRVAHGKAYVEILRVAAEERVDLIVTGVRGRHAVDVMVFGSTTNQVVRRATCPVLSICGTTT
jgi:nucleotide-binding universal stress UspA family protein